MSSGVSGVGCKTLALVLVADEGAERAVVLGHVGRLSVVASADVGQSVLQLC